jgi:hypothetical protein
MAFPLPTRFFPTTPGRKAFGVTIPVQNAGDYITNKKAKNTYCNITLCKPKNSVKNQSDLLLLRRSNFLYNKCVSYNFNKTNLNINLFTKMDLSGVKVIANAKNGQSPTPIIPLTQANLSYLTANPYYTLYKIDPCSELFGNSTCGINNYQDFVVYNPPYVQLDNQSGNSKYNCVNDRQL